MEGYQNDAIFREHQKIKRVTDQASISNIMKDLSTFFQQPQLFVKSSPNVFNFQSQFMFESNQKETNVDMKYLKELIKSKNPDIIKILTKNLNLAAKLITNNFIDFIKNYGIKNNFLDLQNISFAGNNMDFFKLINIDNNKNSRSIFNKDPLLPSRLFLQQIISKPSFYIDTDHIVGTFDHSTYIDFLASSTSLAANQNHIIVGYQTGQLYFIPIQSIDKPNSMIFQSLVADPFSICFKDNTLFVFGQKCTFKVDTQTMAQVSLQRPREMTTPIISDGHLFYSIKKNSVLVFDYNNNSFVTVKELITKINFKNLDKIIAATDGASIVFIDSQNNETINYKAFSALDGSYLWEMSYHSSGIVGAWSIIPSTNQHVIFTPKNVQIMQGVMLPPRWQIGHARPNYGPQMSVVDMYDTALFYNVDIFPDATEERALSVLKYYTEEGNIPGVRIASYVLSRTASDFSPFLAAFDLSKSPELRRYLFAMTLSSIRTKGNTVKLNDAPIVSKFILNDLAKATDDTSIGLIFLFADLFDFEKIELAPNVANILISKVLSRSFIAPHAAEFIIEAYLANFATPELVRGESVLVFIQFQTISQLVQEEISRYAQANALERFERTVVFRVWKRILYCIYQAREFWPSFASTYVKCLDISLDYCIDNFPDSAETVKMLNRSYYLLLSLMFSTNYEKQYTPLSFKDFMKTKHSIYDGSNSDVDNLAYEIVARMYNVQNDWSFAKEFQALQERLLYCDEEEMKRAKLLLEKIRFCSTDVPTFLDGKRNTQEVEQISSVIHWFVKRFGRDRHKKKQTLNQFIIMSFFSGEMEDRFVDFMLTDNDNLHMFVECVRFPFILHPDVVRISLAEISAKQIIDSPVELIEDYFENIVKCINFQQNKSKLVDDLLKEVREYRAINSPTEILRHSLYMNLAASSKFQIDFLQYLKPFQCYYTLGNYQSLESFQIFLRKIKDKIDVSPFLNVICSAIENFILKENVFSKQNGYESVASLFLSIDIIRSYLTEKKALILSKSAIVIAAVLNNTLDCVRKGVSIEFEDMDGIFHEGIVFETSYTDSTFDISSGVFSLDSTNRLIIHRAPFEVDFDEEEIQMIIKKYLSFVHNNNGAFEVFLNASLAFLSEYRKFVEALPEPMKEKLLSNLISEYFPGNCFVDFLYFFGESKKPHFSFSFNDHPNNSSQNEGMIFTGKADQIFTSSTISPHEHSKLILNATMPQEVRSVLVINAFSNITGERFETDPFVIESGVQVEIDINPVDKFIKINGSDQYILSPSITTLFFTVTLGIDSVMFYSFKNIECGTQIDSDIKYMKPGRLNTPLPFYDSDQFIRGNLSRNCFLVSESLKKVAAMNIASKLQISLPKLALDLYAAANPFINEISVEKNARIFGNYSQKFIEFAQEQVSIFGFASLQNILEEMIDDKNILVSKTNSSVLHIGTDKVSLSDSYVISPQSTVPIKVIGVEPTFCQFSTPSIVIPSREIIGTVLAFPLHMRHLLFLGRRVHVRSSRPFLAIIEKLRQIIPNIVDSLFKNTIELIKYLFVEPLRESAMPDFELGALLFPQSTIFDFPQSIKAKALEIASVSMDLQDEPIKLSFIQDTPIFLGVRSSSPESSVSIEYDDGNETMESETFKILKTNSLRITKNEEAKITIYITPVISDFDNVYEEIKNWKENYSQFLLHLDVSCDDFVHAEFDELPISSLVSFQSAKTVYKALESVVGSELFAKQNSESHWCDFDAVGDHTRSLSGRIQYLQDMNFSRQELCSGLGMAFSSMPMISHSDFEDNFEQIFIFPNNMSTITIGFLRQFARDLNPYTVLSFVHAVSGAWDVDPIINGFTPIKVLCVEEKVIRSVPKERLLVIGKFEDSDDFIQTMMNFICSYL